MLGSAEINARTINTGMTDRSGMPRTGGMSRAKRSTRASRLAKVGSERDDRGADERLCGSRSCSRRQTWKGSRRGLRQACLGDARCGLADRQASRGCGTTPLPPSPFGYLGVEWMAHLVGIRGRRNS
ncbi:hypothetical protein M426DRAFT_176795 [Hypoxylon sp. CI-4A]|nr:hypothetical protein M426DRAFT_176795 [Hypoxylon sp. CI-4A]